MTTKLYVENEEKYKEKISTKYKDNLKASVIEVEQGILLPPKKISNTGTQGTYAGGVVDSNFNFISGLKRANKTITYECMEGYKVKDTEISYIDEEVIFGGIIMPAFGNAMIESLSRLWYVVKNKKDKRRIMLLSFKGLKDFHYEFFRLAGIPKERIVLIEQPTRFKKIVVPDETIRIWSSYKKEYNLIYDEIRKNVKPKKFKKVYFTRTQLADRYDVNEEFFEEFYKKRGYVIVSPEQLPLEEQISYASGAEELVCCIGTLSHFALFMDYNSKVTILNRTKGQMLVPQFIINDARKMNCTFVDSILEVLPISHNWGCACMYPTEYFVEYLNKEGIDYTEKEITQEKEKIVYEYLKKYALNYKEPLFFKMIQHLDMFDLVKCLNKYFYDEELTVQDVYIKRGNEHLKKWWVEKNKEDKIIISDLKQELEITKKKLEKEKNKNKRITNSMSWKITKPLRILKRIFMRK